MAQMRPGAKFILILLAAGVLFGGYKLADSKGWLKKIVPAGKSAGLSAEAKEASKKGTPVIKVGINTWGGYAAGTYFNKGFAASTNSRYYSDEGIMVQFVLIDDFKTMRDAWKSGSIDVLGLATVDSLPTEIKDLMEYKPRVFIQTDWSRGGDAVVVKSGINSAADLKGKKVAFALGTPSHSLLMTWLNAGNVSYSDIQTVPTDSGIMAAQQFKAGAVDAAVVWSPDDEDCVKAIPGAKILFNTKKATNVIADVLLVKDEYLQKNPDVVKKFMEGWFKGAAEINTNNEAKAEAAQVLANGFNVSSDMAKLMIDNARISTYGDNMYFFGLGQGSGVRAEELYNKMFRLFSSIGLAPMSIPTWREISTTAPLSQISLSGNGYGAESAVQFTAPKAADVTAPVIATKPAPVTYEFGSATLSDDGKVAIDTYFANAAKEYANARVRIEGNTDSIGSAESNRALSRARAQSVANYLVQKYGFDYKRFVIVGNGMDNPIADNGTSEGRAQNRRTEFMILQ